MEWEWEEPLWYFVEMDWDTDTTKILAINPKLGFDILKRFQGFGANPSGDPNDSEQADFQHSDVQPDAPQQPSPHQAASEKGRSGDSKQAIFSGELFIPT